MISASAVTTRHELIMSLVAGLSLINKVWKRAVMTPYASTVTTQHELIMSLVAGLSLIMQGVKPNGQLNNDENPCQ